MLTLVCDKPLSVSSSRKTCVQKKDNMYRVVSLCKNKKSKMKTCITFFTNVTLWQKTFVYDVSNWSLTTPESVEPALGLLRQSFIVSGVELRQERVPLLLEHPTYLKHSLAYMQAKHTCYLQVVFFFGSWLL